jgi:hypothetical protein
LLCLGTCRHFRDSPPIPPSASEMGKAMATGGHHHHQHHHHHHHAGGGGGGGAGAGAVPFRISVGGFFRKRGFGRPLAAFVFSIAVTNVVGAFIEEVSFCACVCSFGHIRAGGRDVIARRCFSRGGVG